MRRLASAFALALPLAASVGACVTPAHNRREALLRTVHEYNDGLRWKKYERVMGLLAPEEARRFATRTGTFGEDYEMADEEVVAIEPKNEDGTKAEVTVAFSWYDRRLSLLRKAVIVEDWTFTDGRWLCERQRRLRGDGFPLVPEAAPPPQAPPPAPSPQPER
jgi:hypothetical protein